MALVQLSGCGYSIRTTKTNSLTEAGIHRIYITPIINNTYRYGIENVVYNALVRSLAAYGGIKQVSDPALADAVLSGTVTQADSTVNSTTAANALTPRNLAVPGYFSSLYVATEYSAVLSCSFTLTRRAPKPGQRAVVWTGNFTRSSPYPASNQLGVLGTTSGLINDSEFDRTILNVARNMMVDVREAMVSRF